MSVPDTDTNSPVTIPTTTTDRPAGTGQASDVAGIPTVARHRPFGLVPVSYTHLTLPTILLV